MIRFLRWSALFGNPSGTARAIRTIAWSRRYVILPVLAVWATVVLTADTRPLVDQSPQGTCVTHDRAVQGLANQYGERLTGRGLASGGRAMVELLISEYGSWSLIVTDIEGRTCIVRAGESWSEINPLSGVRL